jgi:hypothetical protein
VPAEGQETYRWIEALAASMDRELALPHTHVIHPIRSS